MSTKFFLDAGHIEHLTEFNHRRVGHERQLTLNYGEFRSFCFRGLGLEIGDLSLNNGSAYYHAVPSDEHRATQRHKIATAVKLQHGYRPKLGFTKYQSCEACGHPKEKQKTVDVLMAKDLLWSIWQDQTVSKIIIVTGDSDFMPIIKEAHKWRKKIYLACADNSSTSTDLSKHKNLEGMFAFTRADLEALPGSFLKPLTHHQKTIHNIA